MWKMVTSADTAIALLQLIDKRSRVGVGIKLGIKNCVILQVFLIMAALFLVLLYPYPSVFCLGVKAT